jgi:hypothetical protein
MVTASKPRQIGLFEPLLTDVIKDLLSQPQQPSARELIDICEKQLGSMVRENMKGSVLSLIESDTLGEFKKRYLHSILEDRSLDLAIAGKQDYRERKEIDTGIDLLITKSQAYRNSEEFRELVGFMGQFREYAPYNNMLVRVQNPSCSFYATAKDWENRFQRYPKEDARPMLILAPMHPVMLVYDVDQTEGKELPVGYNNFAKFNGNWKNRWLDNLMENANRHQIRVDYKELSSSNAGFATYARSDGKWKMRIAIHDQLDNSSRFGVLCHELAHIFLGHLGGDRDLWWPNRINLTHQAVEIEAEATAFIVTQQLGLQGSSHAYVSSHLIKGKGLPKGVSLDNIAKAAGRIGKMAKGLLPMPTKKKGELKK